MRPEAPLPFYCDPLSMPPLREGARVLDAMLHDDRARFLDWFSAPDNKPGLWAESFADLFLNGAGGAPSLLAEAFERAIPWLGGELASECARTSPMEGHFLDREGCSVAHSFLSATFVLCARHGWAGVARAIGEALRASDDQRFLVAGERLHQCFLRQSTRFDVAEGDPFLAWRTPAYLLDAWIALGEIRFAFVPPEVWLASLSSWQVPLSFPGLPHRAYRELTPA
jgi:hypothetical protein